MTQGRLLVRSFLEACVWSVDVAPLQSIVFSYCRPFCCSANPKHIHQLVSIFVFSFLHLLLAMGKSEITCIGSDFSFVIVSNHLSLEMVFPSTTVVIFYGPLLPMADSVFGTWTQQVKDLGSSGAQMRVLCLYQNNRLRLYIHWPLWFMFIVWTILVKTVLVIRD